MHVCVCARVRLMLHGGLSPHFCFLLLLTLLLRCSCPADASQCLSPSSRQLCHRWRESPCHNVFCFTLRRCIYFAPNVGLPCMKCFPIQGAPPTNSWAQYLHCTRAGPFFSSTMVAWSCSGPFSIPNIDQYKNIYSEMRKFWDGWGSPGTPFLKLHIKPFKQFAVFHALYQIFAPRKTNWTTLTGYVNGFHTSAAVKIRAVEHEIPIPSMKSRPAWPSVSLCFAKPSDMCRWAWHTKRSHKVRQICLVCRLGPSCSMDYSSEEVPRGSHRVMRIHMTKKRHTSRQSSTDDMQRSPLN